ncbi:hypothetical protein PTNB85_07087 [Pyrenophora teres f. teres]|uniref:Uncharacterized protein n=2 Tax=Pyrenophora teres f. teres TaxID=97479 RepID=A0A6S6WC90_9PLEO|nr:hypothetical protein HRS9139_07123 [Pyrenophora teres f. teres]KAE8830500.1 hypothetical protein PTNB85_07087 [Pyrenophora teres f. teres]KAE8857500.1 hypothetical protein PTNB29_08567 [Pyrenophora teres f. teres]CAE7185341.1 hypothetical protein PTTW11_06790 [Pyrenophora teres f. teres]
MSEPETKVTLTYNAAVAKGRSLSGLMHAPTSSIPQSPFLSYSDLEDSGYDANEDEAPSSSMQKLLIGALTTDQVDPEFISITHTQGDPINDEDELPAHTQGDTLDDEDELSAHTQGDTLDDEDELSAHTQGDTLDDEDELSAHTQGDTLNNEDELHAHTQGDTLDDEDELLADFCSEIHAKAGILIASYNRAPAYAARVPNTPLPPVQHWSDVAFLQWQYLQEDEQGTRGLKYILRESIENEDTLAIVERITNDLAAGEDLYWPGLVLDANSEQAMALLGTPNGGGVAWMLAQHRQQLGHKVVEKVVLFYHLSKVAKQKQEALNLLFCLRDVNAD